MSKSILWPALGVHVSHSRNNDHRIFIGSAVSVSGSTCWLSSWPRGRCGQFGSHRTASGTAIDSAPSRW